MSLSKDLIIANPHTKTSFKDETRARAALREEQILQTLKLCEAACIPLHHTLLNSLWKPDRRVCIMTLRLRTVLNIAGRDAVVKLNPSRSLGIDGYHKECIDLNSNNEIRLWVLQENIHAEQFDA